MSAKCDIYENDLLKLIFHGTTIPGIAENAASSPLTHLQVSLHTADPGEGASQTTSEVAYTGYARVAVVRSSAGWTVTGNSVSPAAAIVFGECTADPTTASYVGIGTDASGAGKLLYRLPISPAISVLVGTVPRLKTTSALTED